MTAQHSTPKSKTEHSIILQRREGSCSWGDLAKFDCLCVCSQITHSDRQIIANLLGGERRNSLYDSTKWGVDLRLIRRDTIVRDTPLSFKDIKF